MKELICFRGTLSRIEYLIQLGLILSLGLLLSGMGYMLSPFFFPGSSTYFGSESRLGFIFIIMPLIMFVLSIVFINATNKRIRDFGFKPWKQHVIIIASVAAYLIFDTGILKLPRLFDGVPNVGLVIYIETIHLLILGLLCLFRGTKEELVYDDL